MQHTATFPAGPKGLPVVGNALQFQRDPLTFMRGTQRQFGSMARLHLGNETIVAFFRPEHVRYFLMEHPRNFKKPYFGNGANLKAFLGDGLLTSDGDFHRQQRRMVQPAFHKKRVEGYADVMVQFTRNADRFDPIYAAIDAAYYSQVALQHRFSGASCHPGPGF